jgi:hypothetical protein
VDREFDDEVTLQEDEEEDEEDRNLATSAVLPAIAKVSNELRLNVAYC